jgi:hypothetical protein
MSVIKAFNHRILSKVIPVPHLPDDPAARDINIRQKPEFHSVEALVNAYGAGIAALSKSPVSVRNGVVDSHFFVACLAPHLQVNFSHCLGCDIDSQTGQ